MLQQPDVRRNGGQVAHTHTLTLTPQRCPSEGATAPLLALLHRLPLHFRYHHHVQGCSCRCVGRSLQQRRPPQAAARAQAGRRPALQAAALWRRRCGPRTLRLLPPCAAARRRLRRGRAGGRPAGLGAGSGHSRHSPVGGKSAGQTKRSCTQAAWLTKEGRATQFQDCTEITQRAEPDLTSPHVCANCTRVTTQGPVGCHQPCFFAGD